MGQAAPFETHDRLKNLTDRSSYLQGVKTDNHANDDD
jgi:hypothetical protein